MHVPQQQDEDRADEEELVPDPHGADPDEQPGDEVGSVHDRPVEVDPGGDEVERQDQPAEDENADQPRPLKPAPAATAAPGEPDRPIPVDEPRDDVWHSDGAPQGDRETHDREVVELGLERNRTDDQHPDRDERQVPHDRRGPRDHPGRLQPRPYSHGRSGRCRRETLDQERGDHAGRQKRPAQPGHQCDEERGSCQNDQHGWHDAPRDRGKPLRDPVPGVRVTTHVLRR